MENTRQAGIPVVDLNHTFVNTKNPKQYSDITTIDSLNERLRENGTK